MCLIAAGAAAPEATPEVAVVVLGVPSLMAAEAGAGLALVVSSITRLMARMAREMTTSRSVKPAVPRRLTC